MALPPQKLRELVFLALFSGEALEHEPQELVGLLSAELKISKSAVRAAVEYAQKILQNSAAYDQSVKEVLVGWDLNRLQRSERVIFWLSLHELDTADESSNRLSTKVIVSEAKRLAKKFSMPKAVPFVHAVISAIAQKKGLLTAGVAQVDVLAAQAEKAVEDEVQEAQALTLSHNELSKVENRGLTSSEADCEGNCED